MRGGEIKRKGSGRCTGGGRRGGGKRDSQSGGKREKKGKIMQHCAIFRNRKSAKRREPTNTGREPGLKGTGSGRIKPAFTVLYKTVVLPFLSADEILKCSHGNERYWYCLLCTTSWF